MAKPKGNIKLEIETAQGTVVDISKYLKSSVAGPFIAENCHIYEPLPLPGLSDVKIEIGLPVKTYPYKKRN